jgi:predicted alpha-1,6-mannanase (GH76 family)
MGVSPGTAPREDGGHVGHGIFNILPVRPPRRHHWLALLVVLNICFSLSSFSSRPLGPSSQRNLYQTQPSSLPGWFATLLSSSPLFTMLSHFSWGGLAARAAMLASSTPLNLRADPGHYANNAVTAINVLQSTWYDANTGMWDNAWWNSANVLTTLVEFASLRLTQANQLNIGGIIQNTFIQAQKTDVQVFKEMTADGLFTSSYVIAVKNESEIQARGAPGFINHFYDDEGWWALALIRAFDVTRNTMYLDTAASIFADMRTGENTNCGGGIYWNKDRQYVNAIANELYLAVAAGLANRASNKQAYLDIAVRQWNWFKNSGMVNSEGTINDGLDPICRNNGGNTWSYNQGVILGALVELNRATGDGSLLTAANGFAMAALKKLTDVDGVLHDSCEPNCGSDGNQFKGIFVRNVRYLYQAAPTDALKNFLIKNADVIWANNRNAQNQMGVVWSGPVTATNGPSHSSAMDAIVAAIAAA